jgi:YegS/Rv2252/BmrU family lipid kinase
MAEHFRTKLIVNPLSANGRTGKTWPEIENRIRAHLPEFDCAFTQQPMHATELARDALKNGYEMVVTCGGDGTNSEVVNGFFENGRLVKPGAVLGVLPMGTGCDFVKTAGIPKPLDQAAQHLAGRHAIACDVGHIRYINHQDAAEDRYFINITDFGIGGDIVRNVNKTTKIFGGFFSFLWGTLRTQFSYRAKKVRIFADGTDMGEKIIHSVVVANGQYCGGGMHIARRASLNDGQFEIVVIHKLGAIQGARVVRSIYSGAIADNKALAENFKACELRAESDEVVLLDVDGEQPGRLPCTLRILPQAIRLKLSPLPPAAS